MMDKLGMSLVLTCYNRQEFVREAILSVFAQDYDGPMQLVIVDDASTDDSVRVIEATVRDYGQGWDVEIIKLPKNLGVAGATDAGWAKAKYDWILIVDGDDVQLPNRCSMVAEAASRIPNLGQISFSMRNVDKEGHYFGIAPYGSAGYENTPKELILDNAESNYKNQFGELGKINVRSVGAATAFHRSLYDIWGPLCQGETEGMRFEQDPTWAFRAALSKTVIGINRFALNYRMHSSNLSNIELLADVSGIKQFELHQEKYQKFRADSIVCKLRDIERAREDCRLTNWSPDLLNKAEDLLRKDYSGCMLRYMWWSIPYYSRILRVMRNIKAFRESRTSILRLLPFHLFCWLKYKKQQREWANG